MSWLPVFRTLSDQEQPWFLYIIVLVTLAQLLLLSLVLVLFYKVQRLVEKLDRISTDAGKFVQMGMMYFKKAVAPPRCPPAAANEERAKAMSETVAYFDCFSGASGDMILGALLDCGLPLDALVADLALLAPGLIRLRAEKVLRGGIRAMQAIVETDRRTARSAPQAWRRSAG